MDYSLIMPKTAKEWRICQMILEKKFARGRNCKEHIENHGGVISYLAMYTYGEQAIPTESLECLKPTIPIYEMEKFEVFETYNRGFECEYVEEPIYKIKNLDKWFDALKLCGMSPKKEGTTYRLISMSDRQLGVIIDKIGQCTESFKTIDKAN